MGERGRPDTTPAGSAGPLSWLPRTCFALTLRSLTSTLLPTSTMGMFSHTRTRSRCQLGTFLYVMRDVTSNMMIAQLAWMLQSQRLVVEGRTESREGEETGGWGECLPSTRPSDARWDALYIKMGKLVL